MRTLREETIIPDKLKALIELCAWLLPIACAALLVNVGVLSEGACVWGAALLLLGIFLAGWRAFEGGRHPCFLFLGLLLVFQGGRLIAHIMGALPNPMEIIVATALPLRISTGAAEITLLLLVLSAVCVYAPCRIGYRPAIFRTGSEAQWLPALYVLILITFPFAFYKNWAYFSFIRDHGGYLAIYTDSAAVLASAGALVRGFALVNSSALLTAYVFERRPKRIFGILILYFALSTLDLLIGFRGKFFSQTLVLWYIHKLKTGRRFNAAPLVATALVGIVVAILVAGFRQDQSIQLLSPIGFLAQQGISLNVTEAAVAFHNVFARFGISYLWGGFLYGIVSPPVGLQHHLLTNDLTAFLNRDAAELGFGTASSYLAELYLAGGVFTVIFGSLAVGFTLHGLHASSRRAWGALLMAFALPSLIYLPRLEFLGPAAALARALIGFLPVVAFVVLYQWAISFAKLALININRSKGPAFTTLPGDERG